MKYLTVILAVILLSSCSWGKRPPPEPREITVRTVPVAVEIYQPPLPMEMSLKPVQGAIVMNKDNVEKKIKQVEKLMGQGFVIIGYVPTTYENMAWNLQEMRRYTNQLKEIVIYYRKATAVSEDIDGDGDVDLDDWILENKRLRDELADKPE